MRSTLALLALAACGRFQFSEGADAAIDSIVLGEFGTPQLVGPLSNVGDDDDPTATGDGLELYFMSSRPPSQSADIWMATRTSRSDAWSAPRQVTELNSALEDQSPGVSADGLTIYLSSRRASPLGGTNSNIWMATRASRADLWSTPVFVAELSTTLDEFEPQPDENGLRLVLYRHLANDNRDVFETSRASLADPWGPPVAIADVNGTSDERSPCLRDGGRELWYTSDRIAGGAVHDIYVATRATTTEPFPIGVAPAAINTLAGDDDPWISPDGHILIFSSTRDGNPEIYEARR